jgi:hypothetical protein
MLMLMLLLMLILMVLLLLLLMLTLLLILIHIYSYSHSLFLPTRPSTIKISRSTRLCVSSKHSVMLGACEVTSKLKILSRLGLSVNLFFT